MALLIEAVVRRDEDLPSAYRFTRPSEKPGEFLSDVKIHGIESVGNEARIHASGVVRDKRTGVKIRNQGMTRMGWEGPDHAFLPADHSAHIDFVRAVSRQNPGAEIVQKPSEVTGKMEWVLPKGQISGLGNRFIHR